VSDKNFIEKFAEVSWVEHNTLLSLCYLEEDMLDLPIEFDFQNAA